MPKVQKVWVIKTRNGRYLDLNYEYTNGLFGALHLKTKKTALEIIKDGKETAQEMGEHPVRVEIREVS